MNISLLVRKTKNFLLRLEKITENEEILVTHNNHTQRNVN